MCGIAGIIQSGPKRGPDTLERMTAALAHRGPDGKGFWQNEAQTVLLGHRRLAILDLSAAGAQPMHFQNPQTGARYSIVHNGEIYNYIELRKQLQNEGYRFHTQSDTEVILAAYDCWQDECVEYFDGMFAFAIWDEEEQELFAARDRFGEKPFFFWKQGNEFLFASEIKALWAAGLPRTANLKMLFNFITIGYTGNPADPQETFFEQIQKLPPASRLYFNPADGYFSIEKYYEIDPDEQNGRITDAEAIEKFRSLLDASVKRRLRSDVAIGCSLSGGLDSSAIAARIHDLQPNSPLHCFTAHFPGFEKDELSYAKLVTTPWQLPHHISVLSDADLPDLWHTFMHHQEEPVGSASAFAQYMLFRLAADTQVKVLLDGQGADEILAGYHKYYKWYWQELFVKRRLLRSREIASARNLGIREKFGFKNVMAALFPDLASVILERQYLLHALQQPDLHRDFIRLQSKEAYYTTPEIHSLNGVLHFNTTTHGLDELLRYADRNAMAHGREVRLPFLNHELAGFVFSLPAHFKIRQGWTKWILRQSMDQQLPTAISWRKDKTGFEPPQLQWMLHPAMQQLIRDARQKLVDHKILQKDILTRPVEASTAYSPLTRDWRYLAASVCL